MHIPSNQLTERKRDTAVSIFKKQTDKQNKNKLKNT